jgi:hypothetical protein
VSIELTTVVVVMIVMSIIVPTVFGPRVMTVDPMMFV